MADIEIVDPVSVAHTWSDRGGLVAVSPTRIFFFYIDGDDLNFVISNNSGATWSGETVLANAAGHIARMEVWYDKWTPGISASSIHIAWTEVVVPPTRLLHMAVNDTTGAVVLAEHTIDDNIEPDQNGFTNDNLSMTKDRDNNLYIALIIDGEFFFYSNAAGTGGGTWVTEVNAASSMTGVTDDSLEGYALTNLPIYLLPGFESDRPLLIAESDWNTAPALKRIVLLQWNTDNNEFDWAGTLVQDQVSIYRQLSAVQRDGDLAVFVAFAIIGSGEVRCISALGPSGPFYDNVVVDTGGDEIYATCIYSDMVNGNLLCGWLEGALSSTVDVKHATSVNSGFTWEDFATFSAGQGEYVKLAGPYANPNTAGVFAMAWYIDGTDVWRGSDDNFVLDGQYTVRVAAPQQEVVSCLTGN